MHHHARSFQRLTSALVATVLLCGAVLAGPARITQAKDQGQIVFDASLNGATAGAISAPLTTETGMIVAQEGAVAIAPVNGSNALTVDGSAGQATALLQFSNYPDALQTKEKGAVQLRIEGTFTMPISGTTPVSGTAGASFGLYAAPAFFELFSFGKDGMLTRNGAPLSLTAAPGSIVKVDARIKVGPGRQKVWMQIKTATSAQNFDLTLGSAFTKANINQLRFQAAAGSALTAADNLRVRLQPLEATPAPPAVIVVGDQDIEQEVEQADGKTFISIILTIVNTGGSTHNAFLVFNLDDFDDAFDLADVGFLTGTGYVAKTEGKLIFIGLGQNNDFKGNLKLKLKFKAKQNQIDIKVNAKFNLQFEDSTGARTIALPTVVVFVPAIVVVKPAILALPVSAIDLRFKTSWEADGGLAIFGLPLTAPITEPNGLVVQYFERARLELHSQNIIALGLIAVELGYTQPPTMTTTPTSTAELAWYFVPTGHLIAKPFRSFWQAKGGLKIFGLPISGVLIEDGREVQYFERARLELHPEYAGTANEVELGLLGRELLARQH